MKKILCFLLCLMLLSAMALSMTSCKPKDEPKKDKKIEQQEKQKKSDKEKEKENNSDNASGNTKSQAENEQSESKANDKELPSESEGEKADGDNTETRNEETNEDTQGVKNNSDEETEKDSQGKTDNEPQEPVIEQPENDNDKFIGTWNSEVDISPAIDVNAVIEGWSELKSYLKFDELILSMDITFNNDGTFEYCITEDSLESAYEEIYETIAGGINAYVKAKVKFATVDSFLKLRGTTLEKLIQEEFLSYDDFVDKFGGNTSGSGKYTAKDGKFSFTELSVSGVVSYIDSYSFNGQDEFDVLLKGKGKELLGNEITFKRV